MIVTKLDQVELGGLLFRLMRSLGGSRTIVLLRPLA